MGEKCILCFVCTICGISFLLIPESCKGSSLPIQFWTGDNRRLADRIKNIPSYNKEMSKLYHYYSGIFLLLLL